jgi:3-carboxy-cis,cis-muconate cycloisomerase
MQTNSLLTKVYGTDAMREIFSDRCLVAKYLKVEVALARAEARVGVIPECAVAPVEKAAAEIVIDFDKLAEETALVGYPILPLVHQLAHASGEAGRFVHWGATTQDIMDTGMVLQVRDALDLLEAEIVDVVEALNLLSRRHRDTPLAGRTHLQHALPVTFGYKTAIWSSMLLRHAERIQQLRGRALVVSFSGAAGTLASLGTEGLKVQAALGEELGLAQPLATWHVARDSLTEVVSTLGLISSSLAKIATDVALMCSTEFGELSEPFQTGRGASSTMPQKRNPISSEIILACARGVQQDVALMMGAAVHDFERATGPWHCEWVALPEAFLKTASACAEAKTMLRGLEVDPVRMRSNLNLTQGLIVAEAVMMALAPHVGRSDAHDLVYAACARAREAGSSLAVELLQRPEVVGALGEAEIRWHCDPENYLGLSGAMVDRVLTQSEPFVAAGRAQGH